MDWFNRQNIFASRTGILGVRISHPDAPSHDFDMPVRPSPTYHDLYPRFDPNDFPVALPSSPPYYSIIITNLMAGKDAEFPEHLSATVERALDFRADFPTADKEVLDLMGETDIRLRLPPPHDHWHADAPVNPAAAIPAVLASKPKFGRLSSEVDDREYQDAWIRVLRGDHALIRISANAPSELRAIFAHEPLSIASNNPGSRRHHHMIMEEMLKALGRELAGKSSADRERCVPLIGALMVSDLGRFPPARDRSLAMIVDALSGADDLEMTYFEHVPCTVSIVAEALLDANVVAAKESKVGVVLERLLQNKRLVIPDHEREKRIESICTAAVLKYYLKCPLLMRANGDVGKTARFIRAVYKLHARNMIVLDANEKRMADRALALITQYMLAASSMAMLFSASRDIAPIPAATKIMNALPTEIQGGKHYFSRFFVEEIAKRYIKYTGLPATRALTPEIKSAILGAAHLALVRGRDGHVLDIRGLMSDVYASLQLTPQIMNGKYHHVPNLARACDEIVKTALRGSPEDQNAAFMIMDGRRWMTAEDEIDRAHASAIVRADIAQGAQWLREQISQPSGVSAGKQYRIFALENIQDRSWSLAATVDLGPLGHTQTNEWYAGWLWTPFRDSFKNTYWIQLDVIRFMSTVVYGRFATLRLEVPIEDGAEGVFVPMIGRGGYGGTQWSMGPSFTMIIQKRSRRPPYALYEETKNRADATTWKNIRKIPGLPDDRPHELTLRGWNDDVREDPYALSSEALMNNQGSVESLAAGALIYGVAGLELSLPWKETTITDTPYSGAGALSATLLKNINDAKMNETEMIAGVANVRKINAKKGIIPRGPIGLLLQQVYDELEDEPTDESIGLVSYSVIILEIEKILQVPNYPKEKELAFISRVARGNKRAISKRYEKWLWKDTGLEHMIIEAAAAYLEILWLQNNPLLSKKTGESEKEEEKEEKKEESNCGEELEKFMRDMLDNNDPLETALPEFMRLLICFTEKTPNLSNASVASVFASVFGFLEELKNQNPSESFVTRITDESQKENIRMLLEKFMDIVTKESNDDTQKRVRSYFVNVKTWKYFSPSEKTSAVLDQNKTLSINQLCHVAELITKMNSLGRNDFMDVGDINPINDAWNRYLSPDTAKPILEKKFNAKTTFLGLGFRFTNYDYYENVFENFICPLIYNLSFIAATSKLEPEKLDLKLLAGTFALMIKETGERVIKKELAKELFYYIDFTVMENNATKVFADSAELDKL